MKIQELEHFSNKLPFFILWFLTKWKFFPDCYRTIRLNEDDYRLYKPWIYVDD